ncbi:MAG: RHS repeat-associated core domain-containing protein [Acidobacteria bacterium]|nr:RHS repeat-associated core domain-containing protein [Acidobacteriota bacterium]
MPAVSPGLFSYDARDRASSGGESYDSNGNVTNSGGVAVTYDFENHLATKNNVQVFYDGDGVRVTKKVGTQTTWYVTAERNPTGYAQVIHEQSTVSGSSFEPVREYVYGLDLIAQRRTIFLQPAEVRFFGYDGHGSTRFLTDANGTITDTYDYDAFGNLISKTGTTPNNYLYAGEQFDPDLNLYYNRARYLDVRSGRFWSMDTFEGDPHSPLSLHKYLYVHADPVGLLDPTGETPLIDLVLRLARFGLYVTAQLFGIRAHQLIQLDIKEQYPSAIPEFPVPGGRSDAVKEAARTFCHWKEQWLNTIETAARSGLKKKSVS